MRVLLAVAVILFASVCQAQTDQELCEDQLQVWSWLLPNLDAETTAELAAYTAFTGENPWAVYNAIVAIDANQAAAASAQVSDFTDALTACGIDFAQIAIDKPLAVLQNATATAWYVSESLSPAPDYSTPWFYCQAGQPNARRWDACVVDIDAALTAAQTAWDTLGQMLAMLQM